MTFECCSQWSCEVVSRMHQYRMTTIEVAKRAGISRVYLSQILNSSKDPTPEQRGIVSSAVRELKDEREAELRKQTSTGQNWK